MQMKKLRSSYPLLIILIGSSTVLTTLPRHTEKTEKIDKDCLLKHTDCLCGARVGSVALVAPYFKQKIIIECIQAIEAEQSFKPLRVTCHLVRDLGEEHAFREFSALLIIAYTLAINALARKDQHRDVMFLLSIISLYSQLSALPLSKLFDLLEDCWNQYQAIVATFPREKEETSSAWVQRYWWVPVVIGGFTFLQFMRWYGTKKPQG